MLTILILPDEEAIGPTFRFNIDSWLLSFFFLTQKKKLGSFSEDSLSFGPGVRVLC